MTTKKAYQSRWALLRRPSKGVLVVLFCFALICLISAPRSSLDFAVCALCTIGYIFLFDCYREFVYPAALRFLHWSLFYPLAFLFSLGCAFGVDYAGKYFGIAVTFTRPVEFMVLVAAAGAIGSMISKRLRHNEQAAS